MKNLMLPFILVLFGSSLSAQYSNNSPDRRPRNNFYVNLFGDGSLISYNYERIQYDTTNFFVSTKIGIGYNESYRPILIQLIDPEPIKTYLTIPHHLTFNIGSGPHYFEVGVGGTLLKGDVYSKYLFYPIIGYRMLSLQRYKMNFRVTTSIPLSGFNPGKYIFIPVGISLGFGF